MTHAQVLVPPIRQCRLFSLVPAVVHIYLCLPVSMNQIGRKNMSFNFYQSKRWSEGIVNVID